ncbi:MAG: hypothetical protein LYZ70_05505 [Nitrososphaerales archaeon]|nr:hypothetical protein [Nitrososphaerales archaeon]
MTILDALVDLESAVEGYLGKGDEFVVLSAVFKLNNEIGKQFTVSHDPALKALQLRVNDVTVAARRNDRKELGAALERVRAAVLDRREST